MDGWTLATTEPTGDRLYLANGYLGTALGWSGGLLEEPEDAPCYVRGVYSDAGSGGIDRLARLPCWHRLRYAAPATMKEYRRELDLKHGTLRTVLSLEEERGRVRIEQTMLASRSDPHQAVIRMLIRPEFDGELVFVATLEATHTDDIEALECGGEGAAICIRTRTRKYGVEVVTTLAFPDSGWTCQDSLGPSAITRSLHYHGRADEEAQLTQLVRVATSLEADDPASVAHRQGGNYQQIVRDHDAAWTRLWETDIEIEGDPQTQQFARAGLYYLWSSMLPDDRWSIAPMGLSSNFYYGHIFWDAELWMYPTLLLTQPEMARACLTYREQTIEPARRRAISGGYRGARFPWEGGFTGEEMTPVWAETRELQIHITADVAIAHWWYFLNTQDREWLRHHGYPMMRECADFWVSRVQWNVELDRYEIRDVQCADEYAVGVDNDAFTNAAARLCLILTARAARILDEEADPQWMAVASQMYIPYDAQAQRHLEFDGYDGRLTKQADVELLTFPLEYVTDAGQAARDLDYYTGVVDPDGPAMSWSVYSIISAQLGRSREALEYLKRSYLPNIRQPFQAFSETPTNNETHFCTGTGGALQALLFGWTGLRLREDHFVLAPLLPAEWTALRLRNLFILGARTDIEIEHSTLRLRRHLDSGCLLVVIDTATDEPQFTVRWEGQVGTIPRVELGPEAGPMSPVDGTQPIPIPPSMRGEMRLRIFAEGNEILQLLLRRLPIDSRSEPVIGIQGVTVQ